ncbi:MAG: DUF5915 domain-containing protein, partial [Candidatus Kapaibacteriota bacterium]
IAREFINRIQKLRKDSNFEVTDRIEIFATVPEDFVAPLKAMSEYIKLETLAERLEFKELIDEGNQIDIDGKILKVKLNKI